MLIDEDALLTILYNTGIQFSLFVVVVVFDVVVVVVVRRLVCIMMCVVLVFTQTFEPVSHTIQVLHL